MWVLPTVMLVTTAVLIFLASTQEDLFWATHPGLTDTPWEFQPPARFIAQLVNGPGFYLTFLLPGIGLFGHHYDFGRLVGVAIFWTWIGWGLDNRLRGTRRVVIKSPWRRASVYALLLGLSVVFIWTIVLRLNLPSITLWDLLLFWGLWLSFLGDYAILLWLVAGVIYFGTRLHSALKACVPQTQ
jgi:hypothetical protein